MRRPCVLQVATVVLLECVLVITAAAAGKKVLLKIQVPKSIHRKHHTNVFVHNHHDHDNLENHFTDGNPDHISHDSHSFGGHHSFNHGQPIAYQHSHSYGHHYSFSHGDDDNFNNFNNDYTQQHPFSYSHSSVKQLPRKVVKAGNRKQKPLIKSQLKSKGQHYRYPNSAFRVADNSKFRQSAIGSIRSSHPDSESFGDFQTSVNKGFYGVQKSSPYEFAFEKNKRNKIHEDFSQDGNAFKAEPGHYFEDYTNPLSVSKYTSAIKHGAIDLEHSNYNQEHRKDLEKYINAYKNPFGAT